MELSKAYSYISNYGGDIGVDNPRDLVLSDDTDWIKIADNMRENGLEENLIQKVISRIRYGE